MEIVSFVILHYKSLEVTDNCVNSILNMHDQDRIRIIIVDNNVNDSDEERQKTVEHYQKMHNIKVLLIESTGGFSYANNCGFRYAKDQFKSSYIVVLNNDIEFLQKDFIKLLDQSYSERPCHIIGPDIVKASTGEHQNPLDNRCRTEREAEYTVRMNHFALKFYSILYPLLRWKFRRDSVIQLKQKKKMNDFFLSVHEGIVPFGACLIFTPMFLAHEEKAFLPETHFFYEEYILAYRCQKRNYRIIYDPSMLVKHESGVATCLSYQEEKAKIKFVMKQTLEACKIYLKYICEE